MCPRVTHRDALWEILSLLFNKTLIRHVLCTRDLFKFKRIEKTKKKFPAIAIAQFLVMGPMKMTLQKGAELVLNSEGVKDNFVEAVASGLGY